MSSTPVTLRPERPEDAHSIRVLTEDAFRPKAFSDGTEGLLVGALRDQNALLLSTVACEGAEIIGHAAFSPAHIGGQAGWAALGPIAVRGDRQGQGVGGRLIQDGLAQLEASGALGCVLEGDPNYYGRFGFAADDALTYGGKHSRFVQVIAFGIQKPAGEVTFHPAFYDD